MSSINQVCISRDHQPELVLMILLSLLCGQAVSGHALESQRLADNPLGPNGREARNQTVVEVKVGFLVGQQRISNGSIRSHPQHSSRLGRILTLVFEHALSKINENLERQANRGDTENLQANGTDIVVQLRPLIVETYGDERESVKQTINLALNQRAHVIVGPDRDHCALESMLAAVFSVPMVSYHCTQTWPSEKDNRADDSSASCCAFGPGCREPDPVLGGGKQGRSSPDLISAAGSTGMVQTKPPDWKIVNRVVELVRKMLDLNNHYPQQLVLLYFDDGDQQRRRRRQRQPQAKLSPSSMGNKRSSSTTMNSTDKTDGHDTGHRHNAPRATNEAHESSETNQRPAMAGDPAGQYKTIGKLLEIRLAQLLSERGDRAQTTPIIKAIDQYSLTVLNWHTTYHYGYMMNPFRRLIRHHLFQPERPRAERGHSGDASRATRCDEPPTTNGSNLSGGQRSPLLARSIYIIVGHYYEHLGLMLALDELGLLTFDGWQTKPRASSPSSGPARDKERPEQSTGGDQSSRTSSSSSSSSSSTIEDEYLQQAHLRSIKGAERSGKQRRPTIVIGVDIEPHDERDDSVPFLRGLLMDANDNGIGNMGNNIRPGNLISSRTGGAGTRDSTETNQAFGGNDLSSLTLMYNHYIGVIPTRPSKSFELLDEMRHFYNRTLMQQQQQQQQRQKRAPRSAWLSNANGDQVLASDAPDGHNYHQLSSGGQSIASKINQTGARAGHLNDLTSRMLQFARLPIEVYYLYDSIALLGEYFAACIRSESSLNSCSQGDRLLKWFADRNYSSRLVDEPGERIRESSFDSQARAEGLFSLIARRMTATGPNDDTKQHDTGGLWPFSADDEFDIGPVGRFEPSCSAPIQFSSSWSSIAEIWWPLWCDTLGGVRLDSLELNCSHLLGQAKAGDQSSGEGVEGESSIGQPKVERLLSLWPLILLCLFVCLTVAVIIISSSFNCKPTARLTGSSVLYLNCLIGDDVSSNWQQNSNWFTENDAENFLHIVSDLLLPSSIDESDDDGGGCNAGSLEADEGGGGGQASDHLRQHEKLCNTAAHSRPGVTAPGLSLARSRPLKRQRQANDEVGQRDSIGHRSKALERRQQRQQQQQQQQQQRRQTPVTATTTQAIDLHCYMFPFPSCKFVHWLIGLHTLKEMLFKYQSNAGANSVAVAPKATAPRAFFKRWLRDDAGAGGANAADPYSLLSGWNRLMFQLPILSQGRSAPPEFKWNDAHGNGNDNRRRCCPRVSAGKCSCCQTPAQMRGINLSDLEHGAGGVDDNDEVETCAWEASDSEFGQAPNPKFKFSRLSGTFFSARHDGSPTLRLLLSKYRTINEHLCHLSKLNHPAIVRLFGVTLTSVIEHNKSSKRARMIIEATERANLRQELSMLNSELHISSAGCSRFKPILWRIWLHDLMEGLEYLHDHPEIQFHGRLCATTCLIANNWRLKLSGFHVNYMRRSLGNYEMKQRAAHATPGSCDAADPNRPIRQAADDCEAEADAEADAYAAPELLERRATKNQPGQLLPDAQAMRLADIYSFGYIMYEILGDQPPWAFTVRNSDSCKTNLAVSPGSAAVTSIVSTPCNRQQQRQHPQQRQQHHRQQFTLVAERVKVDPSFRPPIARLDKILPILSHNLQCAGATNSKDIAGSSSLHNGRQLAWLIPASDTTSTASLASGAGVARRRLITNYDCEAKGEQSTGPVAQDAVEATKSLVESCWAPSPLDRPQSVDHIRQLLTGGLLGVLSHLSYLQAQRRQRQRLWLCDSWSGGLMAHAPGSGLKCGTFALEFYAELVEEASRERFQALAHHETVSSNLKLALLPRSIVNLATVLQSKRNPSQAISASFDNVHLCTFRLLFAAGANNMTNSKAIEFDQLEVLTKFLNDLDRLIGSFRGHLNVLDSQVDSLSRFTIYAGDILAPIARLDSSLEQSNEQLNCSSLTPYNHTRLLTTFAFELIDLVNRCQTKPGFCVQIKCALHTGSIVGGLLMLPSDKSPARSDLNSSSGYLKLARLVPIGQTMHVLDILEQTCHPQRIQISSEMRALLLELPEERSVMTIGDDQRTSRLKFVPELLRGASLTEDHPAFQQQQGYVMMKRSNRIRSRNVDLDSYWLLNGPRVTSSQRLMLPLIG